MNRILIVLMAIITMCSTCLYADDDRPISFSQLPINSQEFISCFFPNDKVSFAKEEKNLFNLKYDVLLVSGIKLEFFRNGDWREIHCKVSVVPDGIIPMEIIAKINNLYPNTNVIDIERDKYKYEITLSNGAELRFSTNLKLLNNH